jgi:general secretion pathway protein F
VNEPDDRHEAGAGPPLSGKEAAQLTEQLAELTAAGTPLAEGLRAAAEETLDRRMKAAFKAVADRLEEGTSLDEALSGAAAKLPPYVTSLVQSGLHCGRLSQVLTELVERHRTIRELRRGVFLALAYPMFLVVAVAALAVLAVTVFIPSFTVVFEDFDTNLPPLTAAVVNVSQYLNAGISTLAQWCGRLSTPLGVLSLAVVGGVLFAAWTWFKRRPAYQRLLSGWHWLISTMPALGTLRTAVFIADFSRLLRILLQQQVPLPEALRLTAGGVGDASIADAARSLAEATAAGRSLSDSLAATSRMPAMLVPLVRWGERSNRLPEALEAIGEMYEGQVRTGAALLTSILPPLAFILVGGSILGLMATLTLPLISLIQNLS